MLDGIDPLVRWGSIAQALGGCCRRTIYEMVKRGDFPPPDRPARKRGEADLWRASTVRRGVKRYTGAGA